MRLVASARDLGQEEEKIRLISVLCVKGNQIPEPGPWYVP